MHLRFHPVRIIRYFLLVAGVLALLTGIWQYIGGRSDSGKFVSLLLAFNICLVIIAAVISYKKMKWFLNMISVFDS